MSSATCSSSSRRWAAMASWDWWRSPSFSTCSTANNPAYPLKRRNDKEMDMEWFDRGKMVILRLTDLGIALLALGIILQLLFGNAMPFLGNDIAVVFYILNRK